MSLPRLDHATHIADQLNNLAAVVKTRSRASLTDANRILETISARLFNALFDWELVNLNTEQANYPAADLGDRQRRIAIQVTNEDSSDKIKHTATKAVEHKLGTDFDRLIVFFLMPRKPRLPKKFAQSPGGPKIETWDLADLLKQLQELDDLKALERATKVLDEEMGKVSAPVPTPKFDISRILKYAPADLIGREMEAKLLNDAWTKVRKQIKKHPYILTFVGLGGEGKTSLVAKWAVDKMLANDWPNCDAAFAWSFYRDGSDEKAGGSSDLFLKEALTFFGDDADKQFAASNAGAYEKGQRLARIVGKRRSLLILDGLEPLQHAPSSLTPGELKDQGIAALLKGLAAASHGLCIVTTRYSLPNLKAFWQTTAPEKPLMRLSTKAGIALLKTLGVRGAAQEFAKLVEHMKGHALTLTLLGGFLKRAFHGDIRQRDRVKFEKADEKMGGGHAFRIMAAYEQWLLRDGGDEGRREVAVLRLMGLFDRPADAGCLAALRSETIPGLTEPLAGLGNDDWDFCVSGLETAKLLTVNRDASGTLTSLDAHPHLRAYFAKQLSEKKPDAWRVAHHRLSVHLISQAPPNHPKTLEEVELLYRAAAHLCLAGEYREAFFSVYRERISYRDWGYAARQFGSFALEFSLLRNFFTLEFDKPVDSFVTNVEQATVIRCMGYCLWPLGFPHEADKLLQLSLKLVSMPRDSYSCAIIARNLASLNLALGRLPIAERLLRDYFDDAHKTSDKFMPVGFRCSLAHTLLLERGLNARTEMDLLFAEAREWQKKRGARFTVLGQLPGFHFWDYLNECGNYADVERLVHQAMKESPHEAGVTSLGLEKLALAVAFAGQSRNDEALSLFDKACHSLKASGRNDLLAGGLVSRAKCRFKNSSKRDAKEDLNSALEIAERDQMKIHLADIHLYRARLFFREKKYPWKSPQDDIAIAEKLINDCGYHRRDEELADAKRAILG